MDPDIEVAVIMSLFGRDELEAFKDSIHSIVHQTDVRVSIVLCIDGPVSIVVDAFLSGLQAAFGPSIHVIRLPVSKGLANALNMCIGHLIKTGFQGFVARMDADDISLPDRFICQANLLKERPDIDVVGSSYEVIDSKGNLIGLKRKARDHHALQRAFPISPPFCHPSVMFQKDRWKSIIYRSDIQSFEDMLLWAELIDRNWKLHNIQQPLIKFRISSDTARRRTGFKKSFDEWKFKNDYISRSATGSFRRYFNAFAVFLLKVTLPSKFLFVIFVLRLKISSFNRAYQHGGGD